VFPGDLGSPGDDDSKGSGTVRLSGLDRSGAALPAAASPYRNHCPSRPSERRLETSAARAGTERIGEQKTEDLVERTGRDENAKSPGGTVWSL
jgi:hypothetical protein